MHAAVVVNPVAGTSRMDRGAVETLVSRVAACAGTAASVVWTTAERRGGGAARDALHAGADLIVAWGGDGTVNEVASVLAGTQVPLGIVPAGSGNGLARELRLPGRPARALEIAFARRLRPIDVGRLRDRTFVNVAGIGFDARVAQAFDKAAGPRGLTRYLRVTFAEILRYVPQHYEVTWDGGSFAGTALMIVFANSRQYGNGASVAPNALLDDGALDLVIVRPTSVVADLWRCRRLFTGTIARDPHVEHAQVREARVQQGGALCCHADGQPVLVPDAFVEVSVRPRVLLVCQPTDVSPAHRWPSVTPHCS